MEKAYNLDEGEGGEDLSEEVAEAKGRQGADSGRNAMSVWASDVSGELLYVEIFPLVLSEYPMINNDYTVGFFL